ncbi:MAG: YmdB family metallophosphoesterase, partial [Thermoleophilia bacterium]|nr:YmdB family metallophosphoesterase [Thermoleophilia bacterium]
MVIVLFFADVVGRPAREALISRLAALKERFGAQVVIANGENATDGRGINPAHAEALLRAGVDVITTGNHIWKQREIY